MFIHEKSITLHIGHQNSSLWENISILLLTGDSSDSSDRSSARAY